MVCQEFKEDSRDCARFCRCAYYRSFRAIWGLGNPVLYDSNPFYGFRPIPDQSVTRSYGAEIKINNLSLRTDVDWHTPADGKVSFLGDSVTYGGSYISNSELFSTIATSYVDGYVAGNAGVNAWGVENIHVLIVKTEYTPASVYVTVLPEGDFYRGLVRLQGMPSWANKPSSALQELLHSFIDRIGNKRYRHWREFSDEERTRKVVEQAVMRLRETDQYLLSKGFIHLIYISPSRSQVFDNAPKDPVVANALSAYGINAQYILDKLEQADFGGKDLYHDDIHFEREGHSLWGQLIGHDLVVRLDLQNKSRDIRSIPESGLTTN